MKTKIDIVAAVMLCILLALGLTAVLRVARAQPIDTLHSSWIQIEAPGTEDGATFAAALALATSAGDFANMTDDAYQIRPYGYAPQGSYSAGAGWLFAFCGTDASNETFSFTMVGWAHGNGMAQVLCEGDGVLGTQDVVTYPGGSTATNAYWADTINLDEVTKWPEIGTYNASGDNEVALIGADLAGIEYIDFVFYDAGGSSETTSIGVYGRRY